MNKAQELEVMVMRAEMYADEVMAKYESAWHGAEAKEIQAGEIKEEEDANQSSTSPGKAAEIFSPV